MQQISQLYINDLSLLGMKTAEAEISFRANICPLVLVVVGDG